MRKPRQAAESRTYHVITRGAGRQQIFEDDKDRQRYLDDLARFSLQFGVRIIAWCLMDNHIHMLLEGELESISSLMQTLTSEYAQYFNERHERIGPLFQGRFKSEPVETDDYLVTVIRYVHNNPAKAGIASADAYRWSSYKEYIEAPMLCHTGRVLDIIGSKEEFIHLHESESGSTDFSVMRYRSKFDFSSDELTDYAISLLGEDVFRHLKEQPKEQRNRAIRTLRENGMSVRQIERITGIGRGIISRAKRDKVT